MSYITLRELIDDILLLVRNNNISESEDFSRAHIESWIKAYRKAIWKEKLDDAKEKAARSEYDLEELVDDEFIKLKETGPMELEEIEEGNKTLRRTKDVFENLFNEDPRSVLAVHDIDGCNIQLMNHIRRHYHNFRRYTFGEVTAYYNSRDGHVYIEGAQDLNKLKYIYVLAIYESKDDDLDDAGDEDTDPEDDVKIPAWMVPLIKQNIMKNELAFMLQRPSDDSNNSTLASVKPHGPQDQEE